MSAIIAGLIMKKKILFVISRFSVGGAEKLVLYYTSLLREDYDFAVASTWGGGDLRKEFIEAGIKIYPGGDKGFFNLFANWNRLKKIVREFKPDIVHTQVFGPDVAGYFLQKKFKIKWVSSQQNLELTAPFWRKFIWRRILVSADKVIAVSQGVFDFCREIYGLEFPRLVLSRNGIVLKEYLALNSRPLFVDKKINLAIAGRLEKQKAHEILWQALSEWENKDWTLHVFGIGSRETELRKLAEAYKISDKIIWHGVRRMVLELGQVDIFVQPSWYEGLSVGLMEAMAAGRLVIASVAAGGELVEDKVSGLLFKTGSSFELVHLLEYVNSHKDEMKKIASVASKKAEKEFMIEKNISDIAKVYDSL